MESGWPAMVTVEARLAEAGFTATVTLTGPEPVPDAGPKVTNASGEDAVHGQPAAEACTCMGPDPPADVSVRELGLRVNEHESPN